MRTLKQMEDVAEFQKKNAFVEGLYLQKKKASLNEVKHYANYLQKVQADAEAKARHSMRILEAE
jgi:hypothetical protein